MSVHPKSFNDLTLAPVALEIDNNLQRLRQLPIGDLFFQLTLQLNQALEPDTRAGREQMILQAATRWVDMHHWQVEFNDDATALVLRDEPYALHLALSPTITSFIAEGATAVAPGAPAVSSAT